MRIVDTKGRKDGGSGYARVMQNKTLEKLLSRVHATVIRNGNELERIIVNKSNCIEDLDIFIDNVTEARQEDGVYLCNKKVLRKSNLKIKGIEPDLLIFVVQKKRVCKVIELKDGDNFNTKKSQGEKEHLEAFVEKISPNIPFVTKYYVCSFNQNNKEEICKGFKGVFDIEHILTGKELCDILNIDYEKIVKQRAEDGKYNFDYFIDEVLKIEEARTLIKKKLVNYDR